MERSFPSFPAQDFITSTAKRARSDGVWVEWDPAHIIEHNGDLLVMDAICGTLHIDAEPERYTVDVWLPGDVAGPGYAVDREYGDAFRLSVTQVESSFCFYGLDPATYQFHAIAYWGGARRSYHREIVVK